MRTKIICAGFFAALLLLVSSTVAGQTIAPPEGDVSSASNRPDIDAVLEAKLKGRPVPYESEIQALKTFAVTKIEKYVVCDPYYHQVERGKIGLFEVVIPDGEFEDYEIISVIFKEPPKVPVAVGKINDQNRLIASDNRRPEKGVEPAEKVRFIVVLRNKATEEIVHSEDPIIVNN